MSRLTAETVFKALTVVKIIIGLYFWWSIYQSVQVLRTYPTIGQVPTVEILGLGGSVLLLWILTKE